MKHNNLVTEIIRGQWLLDHTNFEGYRLMAKMLLEGRHLDFKSKYDIAPVALDILDDSGFPLVAENGELVNIPKNSIAQVNMIGEVVKYGDWCVLGADDIVAELLKAQSYENVDATILYIDGPGGSVKAQGAFSDFKRKKTKPIIGYADDALSLHYWTLVDLCDYVIASNDVSARFGSIGVVSSLFDDSKQLEELGIKIHEIYPDESPDKNLAVRLALEGKYEMIKKEHLSPLAQKFQSGVISTRPKLIQAPGVLTGKTFYADEAKSLGMIDAIGGIDLAIDKAREFAFQYQIKNLI
jgi:protease-4